MVSEWCGSIRDAIVTFHSTVVPLCRILSDFLHRAVVLICVIIIALTEYKLMYLLITYTSGADILTIFTRKSRLFSEICEIFSLAVMNKDLVFIGIHCLTVTKIFRLLQHLVVLL